MAFDVLDRNATADVGFGRFDVNFAEEVDSAGLHVRIFVGIEPVHSQNLHHFITNISIIACK